MAVSSKAIGSRGRRPKAFFPKGPPGPGGRGRARRSFPKTQ